MTYNLKEYITEDTKEKKPILNLNINLPSLEGIIYGTPKSITEMAVSTLNARLGALIALSMEFQVEMSKLSNSDKLNTISKLVVKKDLPKIQIDGYNYTNLDRVMTLKNQFIQIIDILDEVYRNMLEIVNSDISDDEKVYKLNQISFKFSNKLSEYGFDNKTKFPDYYRDDKDVIQSLTINDYKKVYTDLKLNSKRYIIIIRSYVKELNKYSAMINNRVSEMQVLYKSYKPSSKVGKAITSVIVSIAKVLNEFSETFTNLIIIQMGEIKDSLKQDIVILNNLVKEYNK